MLLAIHSMMYVASYYLECHDKVNERHSSTQYNTVAYLLIFYVASHYYIVTEMISIFSN